VRPDQLADLPVFGSIPRSRRAEVARLVDRIQVPAGDVLTRQGAIAREFFVIVAGEVDVIRDERSVARLGPGDFFGEMVLLDSPYRTATVVAATDVELAVVAARELRSIVSRYPDVAREILTTGSRRLVANLRTAQAG
jgi:CRP/FNR family transcriptional regulator, cyclic AMP receptor protein